MIYVFGDYHLNSSRERSKFLNKKYIEWLLKNKHKMSGKCILLGDLLDKATLNGETANLLFEFVDTLKGIFDTIYIINGNHEITSSQNKSILEILKIDERIKIITEPQLLSVDGQKILCLPFLNTPNSVSLDIFKGKTIDFILGHFEYGCTDNKYNVYKKEELDNLIKENDCKIYLGHLHNYNKVNDNIMYIGAMYGIVNGEDEGEIGKYLTIDRDGGVKINNLPFELNYIYNVDEVKENNNLYCIYTNKKEDITKNDYNKNYIYEYQDTRDESLFIDLSKLWNIEDVENCKIEKIFTKENFTKYLGGVESNDRERFLEIFTKLAIEDVEK